MKAAVLREVNRPLEIEEVDIAAPGPREVLIRTGASGVCHSDLHFVEGLYRTPMPVILGHEAAGTIEAVGELVDYVKPGDRVITCLSVFCGTCERCTEGRTVLCSRTGLNRTPDQTPRLSQNGEAVVQFANLSSYAEQMLVHENAVVKIDRDVPFEQLALIGCGATTGLGCGPQHRRRAPWQHCGSHRLRWRGPERNTGSSTGRRAAHHRDRRGGDQVDVGAGVRSH